MTARVTAVSGRRVTLVPAEGACFGCTEGHCGKRPAPFVVEYHGDPVPAPGWLVETGIPPAALAGETLWGILFPLASFIAGYFLLPLPFPQAGEGARAAAGALCLFSGGLALYLIRRRFPPGLPRIIRVIETGGPGEDGPPAGRGKDGIALPVLRNPGIFEAGS
jgi:hypothetical protein